MRVCVSSCFLSFFNYAHSVQTPTRIRTHTRTGTPQHPPCLQNVDADQHLRVWAGLASLLGAVLEQTQRELIWLRSGTYS